MNEMVLGLSMIFGFGEVMEKANTERMAVFVFHKTIEKKVWLREVDLILADMIKKKELVLAKHVAGLDREIVRWSGGYYDKNLKAAMVDHISTNFTTEELWWLASDGKCGARPAAQEMRNLRFKMKEQQGVLRDIIRNGIPIWGN